MTAPVCDARRPRARTTRRCHAPIARTQAVPTKLVHAVSRASTRRSGLGTVYPLPIRRARQHAVDQMRRGVRHAPRRTARTDPAALAAERDDDLVAARPASHPREAVREDAASQVRRELALDVTRQPAAVGISVAQLGEHRLRVTRDQLVQHRALRRAPSISGQRLSGRAGRTFVETAREHARSL